MKTIAELERAFNEVWDAYIKAQVARDEAGRVVGEAHRAVGDASLAIRDAKRGGAE